MAVFVLKPQYIYGMTGAALKMLRRFSKYLVLLTVTALLLIIYRHLGFKSRSCSSLESCASRDQEIKELPRGTRSFTSWSDGVVTVVKPVIQRNCSKIFAGDSEEVKRVRNQKTKWTNALSDEQLLSKVRNCSWVKEHFKDALYVTRLERSFPIAFIFVVHNSAQQVMRLLKFLYRQHNSYCIHPDLKSSSTFVGIFNNIAQCLDNVFIASKRENVEWGQPTLMKAQMNCLNDLLKVREKQLYGMKWKYSINLCGKELPLHTNHEIVTRLYQLNGTSGMHVHKLLPNSLDQTERLKGKQLPFGLTLYKGLTFVALSYPFVHFLATNTTAITLYRFFKKCLLPEEHFYATAFMIPGVPGGYDPTKFFRMENTFWKYNRKRKEGRCNGVIVHDICIVASGDLERIVMYEDTYIFHNKYSMELDHTVMDCMEERLIARNKDEVRQDSIT